MCSSQGKKALTLYVRPAWSQSRGKERLLRQQLSQKMKNKEKTAGAISSMSGGQCKRTASKGREQAKNDRFRFKRRRSRVTRQRGRLGSLYRIQGGEKHPCSSKENRRLSIPCAGNGGYLVLEGPRRKKTDWKKHRVKKTRGAPESLKKKRERAYIGVPGPCPKIVSGRRQR